MASAPNLVVVLAGTNCCVRPQQDVQFNVQVSNNSGLQLTLVNCEMNVSPAMACVFSGSPLLPPFQVAVPATGPALNLGFTQRFTGTSDAQLGHFQAQVCCVVYCQDSAGNNYIAVSNTVQVSIYPLLYQPFVSVAAPTLAGQGLPTTPPPTPIQVSTPTTLPAQGELWFEHEANSGLAACAVGGV
jgi:hypothetical protein